MPNWTRNVVTIKGDMDVLKDLASFVANEDEKSSFDFNKIVPMPSELKITAGGNNTRDIIAYCISTIGIEHLPKKYQDELPFFKERLGFEHADLTEGKKLYDNIRKYGYPHWYDWACDKWGTKWNACDVDVEFKDNCLEFTFDTAWAAPFPIFEELSKKYSSVTLEAYCVYEGYENAEVYTYKNGRMISAKQYGVIITTKNGVYTSYEDIPTEDWRNITSVEEDEDNIVELETFQANTHRYEIAL